MTNAMQRKVAATDAVDLSKNKREGIYYVLETFIDDVDYCDLEKTAWIWSIGASRRRRHPREHVRRPLPEPRLRVPLASITAT